MVKMYPGNFHTEIILEILMRMVWFEGEWSYLHTHAVSSTYMLWNRRFEIKVFQRSTWSRTPGFV